LERPECANAPDELDVRQRCMLGADRGGDSLNDIRRRERRTVAIAARNGGDGGDGEPADDADGRR
jgi:hypothetical protein